MRRRTYLGRSFWAALLVLITGVFTFEHSGLYQAIGFLCVGMSIAGLIFGMHAEVSRRQRETLWCQVARALPMPLGKDTVALGPKPVTQQRRTCWCDTQACFECNRATASTRIP